MNSFKNTKQTGFSEEAAEMFGVEVQVREVDVMVEGLSGADLGLDD